MILSLLAGCQDSSEIDFTEAVSSVRYSNIYNRVIWDFSPTNQYTFDQDKGIIRYQTENPKISAIAEIEVLGTFNLDDKTFLWSDQNSSIQKHISNKVEQFRKGLPKKYQKRKFVSDTDFNKNLLALYSYQLRSNGFDNVRQGNAIIYFALMKIDVYNENQIKCSIDLETPYEIINDTNAIESIRKMHNEMVDVNDRYYNRKELTSTEAFESIKDVHLKYWLNEDEYHFPALSWPCNYAEEATSDWKVIQIKDSKRTFVVYTADLRWTIEHYAYEIDNGNSDSKIIIGNY